jgi:cytochrome c553
MEASKWKLTYELSLILMCVCAAPLFAGSQASDWVAPPREARKANPLPDDADTIAKGKAVFMSQCISCHGETGVGNGPAAKDLAKHPGDLTSDAIQAQTDGSIFWKISTGRAPIDAPEALRASLNTLFDEYETYRAALAKGDDKALSAAYPGLQSAVERMHKVVLEGAAPELASAWKETLASVSSAVESLGKAAALPARRAEFRLLSTKAETAWQQFGHTRKDPLCVFQSADGGVWVQADRTPADPYGPAKDAATVKPSKLLAAIRPKQPDAKKGN